MTRDEILALPDADLVARAAERVMGQEEWYVEKWLAITRWSPLTDWNHCWMVIEAMEAKGWRWFLSRCGVEFQLDIDNCYAVGRGGKRAILEAALIAISALESK